MPNRTSAIGQRLKRADDEELEIGDHVIVNGRLKGKISRLDQKDLGVFYLEEEGSGVEYPIQPHDVVDLTRKGTAYGLLKSIGKWGGA